MSQPPISSPFTYSCGNVGQFEYAFKPFANLGILEDIDVRELRAGGAQHADGLRREPALREIRRSLHIEQHRDRIRAAS